MGRLAEMQRKLLEVRKYQSCLVRPGMTRLFFPANDGSRGYGYRDR